MISCTEYIPFYSELFKYIDEHYGYSAVQAYWTHRFKPDGKGIPLVNFVKKDGLRGAFDYWSRALMEEAADITLTLNEKQGWYKMDMHHCPSKGRLLEMKDELGFEPYAHYCDHCDYYRAALNEAGLDWTYDFTGTDHAACCNVIYDPKVFKGVMHLDKDTVIKKYESKELEYFHPAFHSGVSIGIDYLGSTYGEAALIDYLINTAKTIYRKRIERIKAEGLGVLQEIILDTYKKEHAPEAVETVLTDDMLSVTVNWCPAVRFLRENGKMISKWFPWTTSVVMETIARECGYAFTMGEYDEQTGKTSYCFTKQK